MIWVSYAYYEASSRNEENLRLFLQEAVERFPHASITYNMVIHGEKCSVDLPQHSNFRVLWSKNEGYDLGAHYKAMEHFGDIENYEYFVFLNCGSRGPFLPSYWPTDRPWTDVFVERLKKLARPGICGASIFCHPVQHLPIVESWAFCLSRDALRCLRESSQVFSLHPTKYAAVVDGEEAMSRVLLEHKFDMDCLLLKYRDEKWSTNSSNCNECLIPSRPNSYEGINIHPLETVFYKTFWATTDQKESNVYECEYEKKYTEWLMHRPPEHLTWYVAPEVTVAPAAPVVPETPIKETAKSFPALWFSVIVSAVNIVFMCAWLVYLYLA